MNTESDKQIPQANNTPLFVPKISTGEITKRINKPNRHAQTHKIS